MGIQSLGSRLSTRELGPGSRHCRSRWSFSRSPARVPLTFPRRYTIQRSSDLFLILWRGYSDLRALLPERPAVRRLSLLARSAMKRPGNSFFRRAVRPFFRRLCLSPEFAR